ncbi:MAG: histidine phosphatase family protein [Micrococcales bacterium]|nr:histidine phosphatase family protein [Micrococcales bacterium]
MTNGLHVVAWRHGRTSYNVQARMQGKADIELDEVGHWQARTAAAALAARHEVSAIVSSDMLRARQTAEYLAQMTNLPVTTDPRLQERSFGLWEGLTRSEIEARWPEEFRQWWHLGDQPEGVEAEPRAQVARRYAEALTEHATALGQGTLVVVSHGTATGAGLGLLLGAGADWPALISMRNAHWAHLLRNRADTAWMMSGYNLGPTDASTSWEAGPDPEPGDVADPD